MKNIDMLWELQQLDNRIIEIEKHAGIIDLIQNIKNYKESYNRLLIATKQKADEYKEKDAVAVGLKDEVAQTILQTKNSEERLYSGEVIKPKALSTLQKEIEDNKKELVEKNTLIDGLRVENIANIKQIKRCKAKLEHIKEKVNECNKLLAERRKSTEDDLANIQVSMDKIKTKLLPEEAHFYFSKKENIYPVVVPYIEDNCEGCQMQFSLIFVQKILKNNLRSCTCENCGRLIVISTQYALEVEEVQV